MIGKVLPIVIAGFSLWQWSRSRRARQLDAQRTKSSIAQPQAETTWEGEGGSLPDTGPQLGPEPRAAA